MSVYISTLQTVGMIPNVTVVTTDGLLVVPGDWFVAETTGVGGRAWVLADVI